MDINKIFSSNLIRLRKLRCLSQRELAKTTGLTQRIINYYEHNPKSIPVENLQILSTALNVNISDFFNEKNGKNPLDELDIRWIKKIKEIKKLPPSYRNEIIRHINYLIDKANKDKN